MGSKRIMNSKQTARRIALTIAWFLLVLWVVTILMGCATNKEHPMYDNLLFEESYKNLAYKSVTKKDYEDKDFN